MSINPYFMFATGIENSYPTIRNGSDRVDEIVDRRQVLRDKQGENTPGDMDLCRWPRARSANACDRHTGGDRARGQTAPGRQRILYRPVRISGARDRADERSEEHTSELQSLMRISYAVFCLKK